MGAIVEDTDYRAIGHRIASEVAHTLAGALAVEIAAFDVGESHTDSHRLRDGGHGADFIIDMLGDVDSDITAVAFSPAASAKDIRQPQLSEPPHGRERDDYQELTYLKLFEVKMLK